MATPSSNNPGYYEVSVQKQVPGTVDPATGFISGGGTVTLIQTYADDGTLAYTQTVQPDGSRSAPTYSPAYSKPGQDIPSPSGPLYRRDDGSVIDPNHIDISHVTPGDAARTIADDPASALLDAKKAADGANLIRYIPGTNNGSPFIDNTQVNQAIGDAVSGNKSLADSAKEAANAFGHNTTTPANPAGYDSTNPTAYSNPGGGSGGGGAAGAGGAAAGINTDAIAAAAAASRAMSDKFLADYNASHPNQPPTMTAAQLPPAAQAEMMASIQASQAAGLDPIKAAQAAGLDPIRAAQAAQLDPFSASHASATLLDPAQQAEQRARALDLEGQYGDVIAGKAPSVAELQLRDAEQRQEANQLGLASRASGGGNVALALRTAANNIGRLNQGSSADAALLRAKEIDAARAALGGVIDQTRTGDINFAGQNANLATDVSKTNAGLDTSATLKAAELEAARRGANAGLTTSASLKDADLEAARRAANASLSTSTSLKDAELEAARRGSNAQLTTSAALKDAELEAARRAANASQTNSMAQAQGQLTNTANSNNLTAGLEQQKIDAAAKDAAAKNAIASSGQVITGTVGAAQAQAEAVKAAQAAKDAADKKEAAWLGVLGTGIAALA